MYGERDYFEKGKQILGKSAGGLLVRLLKAKNKNVMLAMRMLELAAEKQDPREWLGKVVAGAKQPDMFVPASVHARQEAARKQIAERDKFKPHTETDRAAVAASLARFRAEVAQEAVDNDERMAQAQRLGKQADTLEEQIDDWEVWP